MEDLVKEVIPLLQYLIPGFMAAWIFYSLTAFKRPDSFGQIIQALIFTFVIHAIVSLFGWLFKLFGTHVFMIGPWDAVAQGVWSALIAISLGLSACYFANSDSLHGWLRDRDITVQTSYPSEWFSAFKSSHTFVVLHLHDERRLYGWPTEWPSDPSGGQFVMQDPSWIDEKGEEHHLGIDSLVIDVSKVQWVEFTDIQTGTP